MHFNHISLSLTEAAQVMNASPPPQTKQVTQVLPRLLINATRYGAVNREVKANCSTKTPSNIRSNKSVSCVHSADYLVQSFHAYITNLIMVRKVTQLHRILAYS